MLILVLNDWESITTLLPELDSAIGSATMFGRVFLIDDASTIALPDSLRKPRYQNSSGVTIIHLRCNMGHQRALAIGLVRLKCMGSEGDAVIIMDGDGEDRPEHVPTPVAELMKPTSHVVVAARTRRLEAPAFQFMYRLFRIAGKLLTGIAVRVGNFSALHPAAAGCLLSTPDLWSHHAAAGFPSRVPFSTVRLPRGQRYRVHSHMDYRNLVAHGLSAVPVFSDVAGARLIIPTAVLIALLLILLLAVLIARLYTYVTIPGWATLAAVLLVPLLAQTFRHSLFLMFIILGNRSCNMFLPLRDAEIYVRIG